MRSDWDKAATWVNLIAGPYTESHAHQDQGSLMIYKGGWLAYDAVMDSHSGLTAGDDRAQPRAHRRRPTPIAQVASTTSKLTRSTRAAVRLRVGGYHAGVQRQRLGPERAARDRVPAAERRRRVRPRDDAASQQQVWSLAFPVDPSINGAETSVTTADHTLTIQRLSPAGATGSIHQYSQDSDFMNGFRLDEQIAGGDQRWLHVITIDGAATNITAVDGNTVSLTVGGKTVKVGFDPAGIGGTLQIGSTMTALGAGIDELPE